MNKLYKSIHQLRLPHVTLRHTNESRYVGLEISVRVRGLRYGGANCLKKPIIITEQGLIVEGIRRFLIVKRLDDRYPTFGFDCIWCQLKEKSDGRE